MNNKKEIDKIIEETLNSLDGASGAQPAPYLFTRVQAKLNKINESSWERTVGFIARPLVALAGLIVIVSINVVAITQNKFDIEKNTLTEQQVAPDEFYSPVAALYDDIENIEP